VLLDLLENELPRMFRFDLLNCSLRRRPVGVLYRARDRPPARLDAAMNAIDLLAGRSLSMMTLFVLLRKLEDVAGGPVDSKRRVGAVMMRECMRRDVGVLLSWNGGGRRKQRKPDPMFDRVVAKY
jgi:hypothetical protein